MRAFALLTVLFVSFASHSAEEVFKITVGRDYQNYSHADLQRRVFDLERAVWQLQQRVFQLEGKSVPVAVADSWLCTIQARGNSFTGTGGSKAVATSKAMDACKAGNDGSAFFCGTPKCEQ